MANPASGLMFGRERRSVDRTKKFPWNVCGVSPRVQRIRITASKPILRVRYRLSAISNFDAIGAFSVQW